MSLLPDRSPLTAPLLTAYTCQCSNTKEREFAEGLLKNEVRGTVMEGASGGHGCWRSQFRPQPRP